MKDFNIAILYIYIYISNILPNMYAYTHKHFLYIFIGMLYINTCIDIHIVKHFFSFYHACVYILRRAQLFQVFYEMTHYIHHTHTFINTYSSMYILHSFLSK